VGSILIQKDALKKTVGKNNDWCELGHNNRCRKSKRGKVFAPRNTNNVNRGRKLGSRVRKVQRTCGFNATTMRCTLKDNGNKNEWCTVGRKSRKCKKSSLGKKLAPKNSKNVLKGKRLIANLRKRGKVKHKIKAKHSLRTQMLLDEIDREIGSPKSTLSSIDTQQLLDEVDAELDDTFDYMNIKTTDRLGIPPPTYAESRRRELRKLKKKKKKELKRQQIINNLREACNSKTAITGLSFNKKTNKCDVLSKHCKNAGYSVNQCPDATMCKNIKFNNQCKKNSKCILEPKIVARKAGRLGSARRCLLKE
jgi:hypothetical protein